MSPWDRPGRPKKEQSSAVPGVGPDKNQLSPEDNEFWIISRPG